MICSFCGDAIADGATFCPGCGAALTARSPGSVATGLTPTFEESPARTGAVLPMGASADATNDVRDSSLILWALVVVAIVVIAVVFLAH